ncbi:MAG TPA: GIY-YIG nuclease family protein [Ignavibacteriaceae bacterium]|jgi:putative endonuclease|nr:MAG: GIY-YIG nuclease superfamily protein [Ignavibacteria bacterium ADurb.Bin266]OQY71398.1 MAG: hypothetical protein B6D44_12895 [Ignavibacteriales bacterium UTCHB2]HQF42521.1 GIY-YIG nuclease family protein [Ignavibacteriaceae bacterium]HQI40124.1 GIY-YIG nuclease family protein [Ignavibacteriaceae bacterium]HQJ47260.1 GIY-YIG nuclease family protein [Ignavibacteriaceae bacterium]
MKDFYIYILECSDSSFYTGVTNNVEKRLNEHQSGIIKGYTSKRLPVKLVFSERFADVNQAIRFEKQVKGWSRKKKLALINGDIDLLVYYSNLKKIRVILRQAQDDNH